MVQSETHGKKSASFSGAAQVEGSKNLRLAKDLWIKYVFWIHATEDYLSDGGSA